MLFQNISKRKLTKKKQFSLEQEKIPPPRHLAKLSIWRDALGILDIGSQLNCLKTE